MRLFFTFIVVLISILSYGQDTSMDNLWKLYNSNELDSIIEKAKPLVKDNPTNNDINLIIGRTYADQADYKNAVPYLKLTVRNDSNTWRKAWALGYLGTCYFMLQDYENSKKSIYECIDLNKTKNATQYAEERSFLFGFDHFYNDWKIVESSNFRFHFQNMSDHEIEIYVSSREEAFQNINKFFNSVLPKKIDFFVWKSRDDAKNILKVDLGFANPEYCVVHSYSQQTKGHEMTHVISNYSITVISKSGLINEGTAVYFDQSNQNKEKIVREWLKVNKKKISIVELWNNWSDYPADISYPLSGLFVRELIENFGHDKFIDFFRNQTYENANSVFGMKLKEVIGEFENRINS